MFGTFLSQRFNNKPLTVVGDGNQRRDFVYVDDVVNALIKAATTYSTLEVLDIGTGIAPTVIEIARVIAANGGEIEHIPKRPGEPYETRANPTPAFNQIGWRADIQWREGLVKMIKNASQWKSSYVWTSDSIKKATKAWFDHLS